MNPEVRMAVPRGAKLKIVVETRNQIIEYAIDEPYETVMAVNSGAERVFRDELDLLGSVIHTNPNELELSVKFHELVMTTKPRGD